MYVYTASKQTGEIVHGSSELGSKEAVANMLLAQGLVVISIEASGRARSLARIAKFFSGAISQLDKVLFTKHLSIMLRAGLTLLESVQILAGQATSWQMRSVLRSIAKGIERGDRLSDCLEQHPKVFTTFYVNIVRAGEFSGTLEENLDHLAVQFTKDYELRRKVKSALMYPTIVLVAALVIGFFFATYVLPQVAALFTGLNGIQLPFITLVLLDVAGFMRENTLFSFSVFAGGLWFIFWFIRLRVLAPVTHRIVLKLPIFGRVVQQVNLARFALVLGTLLSSGVDIVRSMEITAEVLGNVHFKRAMADTLLEIQRGNTISGALAKHEWLFPGITARMIGVGEQAGKLEEVLGYLAEFYELEVESTMKNLSTLLEPVMLLIIGGIALGMAFAILIPIYNFVAAINTI